MPRKTLTFIKLVLHKHDINYHLNRLNCDKGVSKVIVVSVVPITVLLVSGNTDYEFIVTVGVELTTESSEAFEKLNDLGYIHECCDIVIFSKNFYEKYGTSKYSSYYKLIELSKLF